MPSYIILKEIRKLPGKVIKPIPKPNPALHEGYGARKEVGQICKALGYSHVLIVTDMTLHDLGYQKVIEDSLSQEGISHAVFYGISSEPNIEIIEKGRIAAEKCHAECIIALGGGSVLDSCKMIAAGARLQHIATHALLLKFLIVPEGTLPLINIPTTAGTGAELTVGAVVTNAKGKKESTVIAGLKVTDVILDSELTEKAPRSVTAACGIDALSHGLEGCVADVKCSKKDLLRSMQCVKLVLTNLPKVLNDPSDIKARQKMCRAAFYGGNAINEQLAGYVHAFAHPIGATYHVPHGNAIAAALIPVMEFQKDACEEQLAEVSRFCRLAVAEDSDSAAADRLLIVISDLLELCGFESPDYIQEDDYEELTKGVMNDAINYSPRIVMKKKDIYKVLDRIRGIE